MYDVYNNCYHELGFEWDNGNWQISWQVNHTWELVTSISNKTTPLRRYQLSQNYPNPFNPSTTIEFNLPKSEYVELKIYNILGKEVAELVSDHLSAGVHHYQFDGSNLASGIYYYQLVSGDFREVKKMILIK